MNGRSPLDALADIELPAEPHWTPWLALAALLLAALLRAAWRAAHRRPPDAPAEPRARLAAIRDAWRARRIGDREAAYRLAALARLAFELPQLHAGRPAPGADPAEWAALLAQLDQVRYRPVPEVGMTRDAFDRVDRWLAGAAAGRAARR